jgi:lambda family phage portal protein
MTEDEQRRAETAKRIRARWSRGGFSERPLDISTPGAYPYGSLSPINWWAAQMSADSTLRHNLRGLVDKSRHLRLSNPYAERFAHEMEANVLSSNGLTLQMQVKNDYGEKDKNGNLVPIGPDEGSNTAIEDAWWDFWHSKGKCDVTGELTGLDAEKLVLMGAAIDGTPLVRLIRNFENDWYFAIQILDVDSLDFGFNDVLDNGNEIRMSIERDKWGRRVAAWITPFKAGDWQRMGARGRLTDRVRVPFEGFQRNNNDPRGTILAPVLKKRPDQTLGLPWLTPVMDVLNCLAKYEEAELVATRAAAEKMGFFESTTESEEFTGAKDEAGNFILNSIPGAIQSLPVGKHFVGWDPKHPNGNYGDYRKGVLRQIASGLGISYGSLANDRSDSSFSAERTALTDEREFYKMVQQWFIHQFEIPIFEAWLEMALLKSKIELANGSALPAAKIDKFNKPYFQGRRWGYINPQQEINADILAVKNGFKSRRQIVAENGGYIEDVFSEQAQDNRLAEEYDLTFDEPKPKAPDSPLPDSALDDNAPVGRNGERSEPQIINVNVEAKAPVSKSFTIKRPNGITINGEIEEK